MMVYPEKALTSWSAGGRSTSDPMDVPSECPPGLRRRRECRPLPTALPQHQRLACSELGGVCSPGGIPPGIQIAGFYHVTATGVWLNITRDQLSLLHHACLLHRAAMHITVISSKPETSLMELRDVVQALIPDASPNAWPRFTSLQQTFKPVYEPVTLANMRAFCLAQPPLKRNATLVFYLHSKGVTRKASPYMNSHLKPQDVQDIVFDWRRYMEYFLFENPRPCIHQLTQQSKVACGVNYYSFPFRHFSGNFWWSRCDHIVAKPVNAREDEAPGSLASTCKMCGESWLLSQTNASWPVIELWHSFADHYVERYPREKYRTSGCE